MNIQIKHKTTGAVLYGCDAADLRAEVENAVRAGALLDGALLDGASPGPTWADIRGADLDAAIDAHLKEKP